jgi:hypothetical protein
MVKLCLTQQQTNEIVKLCELTYNNKNYVQFLDNIIKLGIESFKTPVKEPEIIIKYVDANVDEGIYKLLNKFNDNELNFNKVETVIDDVKVNKIKKTKQLVKKKPKNKPKIK